MIDEIVGYLLDIIFYGLIVVWGMGLERILQHHNRNKPYGLLIRRIAMPNVVEEGTFQAQVVVVNKHQNPIPGAPLPANLAVTDTESPALGSAVVDTLGVITFTAGTATGDGALVASGDGLQSSAPYAFTVTPDVTPFGLQILGASPPGGA